MKAKKATRAPAKAKKATLTAPADTDSVIQALFYASPYTILPPGVGTAGVTMQSIPDPPTPPNVQNPVMVIRLRLGSSDPASKDSYIGISNTSQPPASLTVANFQPLYPLSAAESYMVDVIWVREGAQPESIPWADAKASAPVSAANVNIESADFDGTNVTANLSYSGAGIGTGAQVNVYSLSNGTLVNVGSAQTPNNTVVVPVNAAGNPPAFFISAQTAIPVTNAGGAGSFSPPYSLGPQSLIMDNNGNAVFGGIPQAVSAITEAAYDGKIISLSWSLGTQAGCVSPTGSIVQVLSGGTEVIGTFDGGPTYANIPIDVLGKPEISVSVRTTNNNISSAPVVCDLITQTPVVTNIAATHSQVTASVATVPSGVSSTGYLMDGSNVLAGPVAASNNQFTFDYNALGKVGLSVVATAANGKASGPQSAPVTLLATAPAITSAKIYTDPVDAQQWRVDLEWDRLPDAAEIVSSYSAFVYQGSTPLGSQTITGTRAALTFAKSAVTAGQVQTIQLYATAISGGNSPTQTLAAIFTAPQLTALSTGNDQLSLGWTAPTIPPANQAPITYQPVVTAGNKVIYTGSQTSATQGAIPLSELAILSDGPILAMVNVSLGPVTLLADSGMGAGTNASPILAPPVVGLVTSDAVTEISTLNWARVPGAAAYTIDFTNETQQTGITATNYPLPNTLAPGAQLGYTIRGTETSNGTAVTGPPSSTAFVPTNPANVSEVRFDGSNVFVSWEPVANALSYNVLIYDNSTPAVNLYSGTTSETSSYFAVSNLVAGKVYTVYVQPLTDTGVGLCGMTQALFSPGFFLSQQPAAAAYPYVYSAQTMSALGKATTNPPPQAIVLYLPELGASAGALGTAPITVGPFTMEPSGNTGLPYKLTIAADPTVWSFTSVPIRAILQQNYVDFLKALEKPPPGGFPGAVPHGISLVQSAIACSMPQTFAEQLYYNFGFSTSFIVGAAGYVDLRPGMILRVSTSNYINIGQTNPPSWINGYAGASVLDFEIGSYSAGVNWNVGFDSFLSTLSAQGALNVSAPNASGYAQAGLGGAVDLYYTQFVKPFYRLFIPATVSSSYLLPPSNSTKGNFTLAAAASYTALQAATVDPSTTPTAYFRGRTTVEVMIKVMVNGNEQLVPVGTGLGNLLEQLNMRPSTSSPLFKQLRLYRSVVPAITDLQMTAASGPQLELNFGWNGLPVYSTSNGLDGMSAPLLPGDQIFTDKK
jgi:hypothetical protein